MRKNLLPVAALLLGTLFLFLGNLRAGLRMNVMANPGVAKVDFELWSLAASAVNGCGACLDSHEQVLRQNGLSRETIQEAFKIASVVHAFGVVLDTERVLTPTVAV